MLTMMRQTALSFTPRRHVPVCLITIADTQVDVHGGEHNSGKYSSEFYDSRGEIKIIDQVVVRFIEPAKLSLARFSVREYLLWERSLQGKHYSVILS